MARAARVRSKDGPLYRLATTIAALALPRKLDDYGALRREELAEHRTMAARLVLAVAPDGKVRVAREEREHLERVPGLRPRHLGAVLLRESRPLRRRLRGEPQLHRLDTRGERREPGVVEVAPGELALRHPARRAANGAQARPLACGARRSQSHDANRHGEPPACRAVTSISMRTRGAMRSAENMVAAGRTSPKKRRSTRQHGGNSFCSRGM